MADAFRSISASAFAVQRQITHAPHGHVLTNVNVWSPDSRWIVYDVRSDVAGSLFDGRRIEAVNVNSGEVKVVYESEPGTHCGVATFSPAQPQVAFICGPRQPAADWSYNAWHREGLIVDFSRPDQAIHLDARDVVPPFTPGALRGGTHVHIFSDDGLWVSFTYEDHILATADRSAITPIDLNQRNVGVCGPVRSVQTPATHLRNHDGSRFTVLVTRTHDNPRPGSDEIQRAVEDAWVGTQGYIKADGTRQRRALAFQGEVVTEQGQPISEVFIVDISDDITQPGDGPLQGAITQRPHPPRDTVQRRLTYTTGRRHPGIQGPRHWLRSSPDGARIAFLMKDDAGIVQLWTVSPQGGPMMQLTGSPWSIASAFTWSPDGQAIACVIDRSVFLIGTRTGHATRLTPRSDEATAPRPEACVFSPDGKAIAYVRTVETAGARCNQIFTVQVGEGEGEPEEPEEPEEQEEQEEQGEQGEQGGWG